ncbi:MAG: hypothetical protein K9H16_14260 [Bacteroidales bacterium]|nr:hypothetical protein [Bacteroidales bacterium]
MKRFSIAFLIVLPLLSLGQYNDGFLQPFYFGRVPNARAEAMGKAFASIDGDLAATFYNPAGLSNINGLEVTGGYASPFGNFDDNYYLQTGAGYRLNQYLQFAVSSIQFRIDNITISDIVGNTIEDGDIRTKNYTLTLASEPLQRLFVGLNMNYILYDFVSDDPLKTLYFDLGLIRKFVLLENTVSRHTASLAISVSNLNSAKASGKIFGYEVDEPLPIIARYGANYQFALDKNMLLPDLTSLEFLAQAEYQDLWNSSYHSSMRFGGEVRLLEILALRAGYYTEQINDYGHTEANKNEIEDFTYGFGLQVPLDKLTNIPLRINFDFASFPQTSYSKNISDSEWDNYTAYNLKINWMINRSNQESSVRMD